MNLFSAIVYSEALDLAAAFPDEDPAQPTNARILDRTIRLQRTALAAGVASTILQRRVSQFYSARRVSADNRC